MSSAPLTAGTMRAKRSHRSVGERRQATPRSADCALFFGSQRAKATPVLFAGRAHDGHTFEQKAVLDIPLKFVEQRLGASRYNLLGQRVNLNEGVANQAVRFLNLPSIVQCSSISSVAEGVEQVPKLMNLVSADGTFGPRLSGRPVIEEPRLFGGQSRRWKG